MQALYEILIPRRTLIHWRKYKIMVPAGFVEVDFAHAPLNSLNPLRNTFVEWIAMARMVLHNINVVENCSGHRYPLDESTCH